MDEEMKRRLELVEHEVRTIQESSKSLQISMAGINTKLTQLVIAVEKISNHAEKSIAMSEKLKSMADDVEILFEKMRSRDSLFIRVSFTVTGMLVSFFIWYVQKIGG